MPQAIILQMTQRSLMEQERLAVSRGTASQKWGAATQQAGTVTSPQEARMRSDKSR